MRDVVELLSPQAVEARRRRSRSTSRRPCPTCPPMPGQLRQVLVNLVMNSIDACDHRRHRRASRAWRRRSRDRRGRGRRRRHPAGEPALRSSIRSSRPRSVARAPGSGLWVVAQLVRCHGAEIELVDRDRGTAFILALALRMTASAPVLIVDDHIAMAKLLAAAARRSRLRVRGCRSRSRRDRHAVGDRCRT